MSQIAPVISLDGTNLSSSTEYSPREESSQITLISASLNLPSGIQQQQQQQNGLSSLICNLSGTIDSLNNPTSINQTTVGNAPTPDMSSMTMILNQSLQFHDQISSEQTNSLLNESTDQVNLSSLGFLQTKQRQINHRRNKSEPLITANLDEHSFLHSFPTTTILESSSTSNESTISHNGSFQNKRKSTKKSNQISDRPSSSTITTTKKKKAWYNPFQSTYRQRNEEFRKIFKELPHDERLIVDYSCAWQKEILIQGRMYISQNYLCFHANFLKWETSLCLKFKDILTITREKTAKVIPNAIEVKSNKNEKYFFASFATRDKSHALIFRVWQTVSVDQPISSQQLWTMIKESYGNDLDMITDEEDVCHKPSNSSTPDKTSPSQQTKNKSNEKYERVTPNSVSSKSSKKEETDDHSSISSRGERHTDDDHDGDDDVGIIPIGEEANTNTLIRQPTIHTNKQDHNLVSMATLPDRTYLPTCPCQSHLATKLIDRTYPTSVERLFDYIFDDRDFLAAYHASRRIKEFQAGEWVVNSETGKRERLCTYKVDVAAVFGATTICSNEKQFIDCESSKSHYIVDSEVRNEGIKYADTFYVASRYCLVQIGPNKSHLKVTCEVRYVKSVMMIIKSFVEKNAMAALQDSFTDLMKRIEHETSHRQRASSITNHHDKELINNISKKKHSRKQQQSNGLNSSSMDESSTNKSRKQIIDEQVNNLNQNSNSTESSICISSSRWSTNNLIIPLSVFIMLILLGVNIFLCVKLNQIDRMTDRLLENYPLWSNGYSYPKEENQWSILLKRQEEYYQTKLHGLHSVLISTHNALINVTDALNQLSKWSSGSTRNTPTNRLHSL